MRIRKLITAGAIALGAAGGCLALPGAQAFAVLGRPLAAEIGSYANWSPYLGISGVAVDREGNVIVPDPNGAGSAQVGTVDAFGAEGGSPIGLPAIFNDPLVSSGIVEGFKFNRGSPAVDNACQIEKLSGGACAAFDSSNGIFYVTSAENTTASQAMVFAFRESDGTYEYLCRFEGFTEKGGKACYAHPEAEEPTPENLFLTLFGGTTAYSLSSVAVDRKGDVYVSSGGMVFEYNSAGEDVRKLEVESLLGGSPAGWLAVDGKGDVYVNAYPAGKLLEFERGSFTGAVESSKEISATATGVAFDVATGRLFVDEGPVVAEYDEAGEVLSKFGEGVLSEGEGVAVNEATGDVYVVDSGERTVDEFGALGQYAHAVSGPPSSVHGLSATVTGSVGAESATLGASCHVVYGLTRKSYLSTAPCSPESIAAGPGEVPITASLTGLEGNTTYHYRVTATNATGTSRGTDQTFTTPPEAPVVLGELAAPTAADEAVLAATVIPENEATTYHFVYGTTPLHGQSFPVHDLSLNGMRGATRASLSVGELQPGTTYHYAVVATNGAGSRVGPDQTFTTPPPALPMVVTGGAGEVEQNTATISGTVDPQGVQSTYEFDLGTDTDYGVRVFADAGSGTGQETFTLGLRSLAPGTVYHYRVVATNMYGTTYGADRTFTTSTFPASLLAAPSPEPLVASAVFVEPSTAGAIEPRPPAKGKAKKKKAKARKRHRAKGAGAKRSSGIVRGHGNGRGK